MKPILSAAVASLGMLGCPHFGAPAAFAQADFLTAKKIACTAESAKRCAADGKCVPEGTSDGKKDVMAIDFTDGRSDLGERIVDDEVKGELRHFAIGSDRKVKATLARSGKLTVIEQLGDGRHIIAEGMCVVRS